MRTIEKNNSGNFIIKKFMHTNRLHKACVDGMISKLGLYRSRHMMLMFLAKNKEGVSQKDISEISEISPAAVTVSLKKLESEGYIEKKTNSSDGRFNKVFITEKGCEVVERSCEIFSFIDEKMCEGLNDSELAVFEKCLDKMYENLKNIYRKGDNL